MLNMELLSFNSRKSYQDIILFERFLTVQLFKISFCFKIKIIDHCMSTFLLGNLFNLLLGFRNVIPFRKLRGHRLEYCFLELVSIANKQA